MPFLSIPLKKTYEVDLADPIRRWISSSYSSADHPEDSRPAISELHKLRNNAVCKPLDKHEASAELLARYYDQLVAIESKIPFSPTAVPLAFKWKDAFDKGSLFFGKASLTLCSSGLEKSAVLFNIGAMQSQIAAVQELDNDGDLKHCAKLFQLAAGIFNHLKDNVMGWIGQEPTPDLMPDTLSALSALMVAQAQEAIYIKAARDKMKPQLVAKIAAQASDFYAEASRQMNREMLRGLWEKDSLGVISAKQSAFLGLAHYYQSLLCKDEKEIGAELAHLTRAQDLLSTSVNQQVFSSELSTVQKAYNLAKKDNDFIYHERVPDPKSLPVFGKAVLAKPLPVASPMSRDFKDLFGHLVPVQVQQAMAAYDSRRTEIINGETTRMREGTNVMNGILASLNLPAALEDACSAQAIPQSVRDKANAVRSAGGAEALTKMLNDLPALLQRNREILDETNRLVTEEKQSDDALRAQYKEKWTRLPSEKLTEPLWQEVGKYRGILDTAANADGIVRGKFDTHRGPIELLSKPESDLLAAIPSVVTGTGDALSNPTVQKLRQLCSRVEAIKHDRVDMENEIKEANTDMSATFLRALAESGAVNEEQLSTDKLNDIYAPLRERVSASLREQESLMGEIQASNSEFVATIGSQGGAREQLLKELVGAHDTYMELRGNLQEGTKFYNDLTPLLVRLQQKVSDFCFARKTEKEELLRDLQGAGSQAPVPAPRTSVPLPGAASPPSNQPPDRPPPPRFQNAPSYAPPTGASAPPTNPGYGGYGGQAPPQAPYPAAGAAPYPQHGQPMPGGYPSYNPYPQTAAYGQPGVPQQNTYGGSGYPPTAAPAYPNTYPGHAPNPAYPGYPYGNPPVPAGYNPYAPIQQPGGQQPPYNPQQPPQWGPR